MKKLLATIFLLSNVAIYAQSNNIDLEKEIPALKQQINNLKSENGKLQSKINALSDSINHNTQRLNDIGTKVESNANTITQKSQELGDKIQETGKTSEEKISAVNDSLSQSTLYWIIGFLATALLLGLVYFLLGKRIKTDRTDVEEQISKTKKSLEEEAIKLDTKLTEVLETQLKIVQAERNVPTNNSNEEADHSLALKVADEIMRINKNLSNMDASTKGLKQLAASVKRIEDNFAANGYDMPELLNKPFDSRMKLIVANSIPDEKLKSGEEIITRIIKPQVNFKGVMIQAAQVEVSVGQ